MSVAASHHFTELLTEFPDVAAEQVEISRYDTQQGFWSRRNEMVKVSKLALPQTGRHTCIPVFEEQAGR
jgi:hypothetical protein